MTDLLPWILVLLIIALAAGYVLAAMSRRS